jgi:signal transduction histidine kinase
MVMIYAGRAQRLADDLQAVNARLLATRSLLGETARDHERLRLSRELHDVAGHKLTALKLNLRGLARRLDGEAAAEVDRATALADELLQDLRSVVRHLREGEGIDLVDSLHEVARPFPRPRLELAVDDDARVPRADQAEALLRVVQEGLTNAARHGPAETVRARLNRIADRLVMTVEDDGRAGDIRPGSGLTGMRERLAELDGSLEISRSALGGVKLSASLPMELHR